MARLILLAVFCLGLTSATPRLDAIRVFMRGHQEVELLGPSVVPFVIKDLEIGMCLKVPATADVHGWRARLRIGSWRSPELAPSARVIGSVCFEVELPEGSLDDGDYAMCLRVKDLVDGTRLRPPCLDFRFESQHPRREELWNDIGDAMRAADHAALLGISEQAASDNLNILSVRSRLMATHFMVRAGTVENLRQAEAIIDALPEWLEDPAAARWAGMRDYQRARLLEAQGERSAAWAALESAVRHSSSVAGAQLLGVAMRQVSMLVEQGAINQAAERLRSALEDCELTYCQLQLVAHAKGQLAWILPQLTDVSAEELRASAQQLTAIATEMHNSPEEQANHLINLALVRLRLERIGETTQLRDFSSSQQALDEASVLLGYAPDGERTEVLRGWLDLVAGLMLLESGDFSAAAQACGELVKAQDELAAWAAACAGQARRLLGDLDRAGELFDLALLHHEHLQLGDERATAPLGPNQRADVFYRAARLASERGDPHRSWEILSRLDALATDLVARRQCRLQALESDAAAWASLDSEASELFGRLAELEKPVAGAARALRRTQIRETQRRLREIFQTLPGCPTGSMDGPKPDLRLIAFDDELWALLGEGAGAVSSQRLDFSSTRLSALLENVAAIRGDPSVGDQEWRQTLEPLAASLVEVLRPFNARLGAARVVRVALHGVLQDVPLAALPRPGGGWWGDERPWALVPAAANPRGGDSWGGESRGEDSGAMAPLFISDASSNLLGGSSLLPFYRQVAPEATILAGGEATRSAFADSLPNARWLHFDGHGRYDPAFPELSGLVLADGQIGMADLAALDSFPALVNLSGCRTGAWPRTADSGRYGLGGLFVRGGASWVIASREDLDDRLAKSFNQAFYRALGTGEEVPQAFQQALRTAAEEHGATLWSSLILLSSADTSSLEGGNSSPS